VAGRLEREQQDRTRLVLLAPQALADVIDAPAQQCQVARHESVDGLDTEFIAEFAQVVVGVTPGTMVASPAGALRRRQATHDAPGKGFDRSDAST
jgi:hypothetical protein